MAVKKIAIIGGGITGLSTAFYLEKFLAEQGFKKGDFEMSVYDASGHIGGKIGTKIINLPQIGNFLIENGPDCFFSKKVGVQEILNDLELESKVIEPLKREFAMLVGGNLHRVPSGLASFNYSENEALLKAPFLSEHAKQEVLNELNQPKGCKDDESIHDFFSRRFGKEFCQLVAEPLLAGTHAGNPNDLSMRALYPAYLNLERKYGSIAAGMKIQAESAKQSAQTKLRPSFISFRDGMRTLIEAFQSHLNQTRIHLNSKLESIHQIEADVVVLALPSNSASNILAPHCPNLSKLLVKIPHESNAVCHFIAPRKTFHSDLDFTGFLVPSGQEIMVEQGREPSRQITCSGATFASQKWENRAPEGWMSIRIFLGGNRSEIVTASDERLFDVGQATLNKLFGNINGLKPFDVRKWLHALPQYQLGHIELLNEIKEESAKNPGLFLTGTSYGGVGIPDCIRQGKETAIQILQEL